MTSLRTTTLFCLLALGLILLSSVSYAEQADGRSAILATAASKYDQKQYLEALTSMASALELGPTDPTAFDTLTELLGIFGHWKLMGQALQSCLGGFCNNLSYQQYGVINMHLAMALDKQGDRQGSRKHLNLAYDYGLENVGSQIRDKRLRYERAWTESTYNESQLEDIRARLDQLFDPIFNVDTPARVKLYDEF